MNCRPYAYWSAFVASLGGFLQSYATCAIAGALLFLSREFHLTPGQEGLAASIILIGALMGSCVSGYLADRFGRRTTLIISAVLYVICNIPILFISSFSQFLFLRFATGIAAGITSLTCPLYLAEIAPSSKRGAFVACFQLAVTIGTLVAYVVNLVLIQSAHWRGMLFFTVFPAVFQGIALFFTPESPKWLFKVGKTEKSAAILQSLHDENGLPVYTGLTEVRSSWKGLLAPMFKGGLCIGFALVILQQWCGINAIVYYAPKIFQTAGFSTAKDAMFATLLMGIVNVCSTLLSLFLIDRLGRRKLLLISVGGVIVSLSLFSSLFLLPSGSEPMLSVISLMAFIIFYSIGLGPIVWVLISEIYPLAIRARAIAVMTFVSWTSNFLVVQTFPTLLSFLGSLGTFAIYIAVSIGAFWLYWRIIPETKGKSLEEIEQTLYR